MTTLKERAEDVSIAIGKEFFLGDAPIYAIESALLAFGREVLEREPSEKEWDAGSAAKLTGEPLPEIFKAMSAVRAKELEE